MEVKGISDLIQRPTVTTVHGSGSVLGEFDRVKFSVSITGTAQTGGEAKRKIKKPLADLEKLLKASQEEHQVKFVKRVVSPYSVSREERWDDEADEHVFSHYAAKYSVSFVVLGTEHTTVLMDELTEIEGVEVASPTFQMNWEQQAELKQKALAYAVDNAKAAFAQQCALLGKNPEDFEVHSWSEGRFGGTGITGSTGTHGPTGSAMNSLKNYSSRIVVNSGEARVDASISLSYTHNLKSIVTTAKSLLDLVQKELM